MATRSVSELAQTLTESERKELVERIQRSLSLGKKEGNTIYHTPVSQDYRQQMIRQGLQELGIWQRIMLWIKRVMSGKNDEDIYVDLKMAEIARALEGNGLADTEARYVASRLAEQVYKLYQRITPLLAFYRYLWGSEKNMRIAVQFVLQQKIPRAKMAIHDYIAPQELESIFEASESKTALRQELLNRLNNYMDGIPGEVFAGIEEGLLPLYYLKEICFFDFAGFFRFFQAEVGGQSAAQPSFKPAAVDKVADELEHLYYAMYTARKGSNGENLHAAIYEHFLDHGAAAANPPPGPASAGPELFAPPEPPEPPPPSPAEDEALAAAVAARREEGFKELRRNIRELRKEIDACNDATRLADLIRFFRADPYYKFLAYVPSLNLREFFYASTRMALMESLDGEFAALRRRIIDRIVQTVFTAPLKEFDNYRAHLPGFVRAGLPGFRYVYSVNIVHHYFGTIFMGYVRDMLRLLMKVLPSRNRDSSSELNFHINGVESLYEKIKALDLGFAPENEEGKTLIRLRMNMEKDISQERTYRIYIAQKDKEVRSYLEEGIDHLRSLAETLDEVLKLPPDMIDERFRTASGMQVEGGFHARFRMISRDMKQVQRAARYQRVLEEEGG